MSFFLNPLIYVWSSEWNNSRHHLLKKEKHFLQKKTNISKFVCRFAVPRMLWPKTPEIDISVHRFACELRQQLSYVTWCCLFRQFLFDFCDSCLFICFVSFELLKFEYNLHQLFIRLYLLPSSISAPILFQAFSCDLVLSHIFQWNEHSAPQVKVVAIPHRMCWMCSMI